MTSLKQRSYQKELLDDPFIPFIHIKRNMQELALLNHRLGGHATTIRGLQELIEKRQENRPLTIVELGSGGGDNLAAIKSWAEHRGLPVRLIGIDIKAECIAYAREQETNQGMEFIHSDYKDVSFEHPPDIVFSSLFCHHFTDEELVFMMKWMCRNARVGFFINDLHRHLFPYFAIKILTHLFSKSYLVKNDAPLSVKRGFKRKDWERIFASAGISQYKCRWCWAFRWLITSMMSCS